MIINPCMGPVVKSFSRSISSSNDYNIFSIKIQNCSLQATEVTVYHPPNTTAKDTTALFCELTRV